MVQRLKAVHADIASLNSYVEHLANKVQFLLDATLGFINIEQNDIVKILTVVSVVGVPPVLIAGVYGMNFKNIPEYNWAFGYPYSLILMLVSAMAAADRGSNGEAGCDKRCPSLWRNRPGGAGACASCLPVRRVEPCLRGAGAVRSPDGKIPLALIADLRPAAVINASAYTAVDQARKASRTPPSASIATRWRKWRAACAAANLPVRAYLHRLRVRR